MKTVLVVEDDPETREILEEVLSCEGYVVRLAKDGIQALEVLREGGVDFALLDLLMPRMNGLDLVQCIRRDRLLDLDRVLITTALLGAEIPADISLLQKPFDLEELLETIGDALARRVSAVYETRAGIEARPGLVRAVGERRRPIDAPAKTAADGTGTQTRGARLR